jgi:hypothetical protein
MSLTPVPAGVACHSRRGHRRRPRLRPPRGGTAVTFTASDGDREIAEETGWAATAGPILDAWLYHVAQAGRHVFIVTYGCHLDPGQEDLDPVLSAEHQRIGLFAPAEIAGLVMPQGYKASIATWLAPRPARSGLG